MRGQPAARRGIKEVERGATDMDLSNILEINFVYRGHPCDYTGVSFCWLFSGPVIAVKYFFGKWREETSNVL